MEIELSAGRRNVFCALRSHPPRRLEQKASPAFCVLCVLACSLRSPRCLPRLPRGLPRRRCRERSQRIGDTVKSTKSAADTDISGPPPMDESSPLSSSRLWKHLYGSHYRDSRTSQPIALVFSPPPSSWPASVFFDVSAAMAGPLLQSLAPLPDVVVTDETRQFARMRPRGDTGAGSRSPPPRRTGSASRSTLFSPPAP